MPERQAERSKKQGVHGWRAFSLMFGCGTVAALVMVGGVVGIVRSLTSDSGVSGGEPGVVESRQPRETMPPELLDLCELVEAQSLMSASPYNRTEEEDDYIDTATGSEDVDPRTVSDECAWEVTAGSASVWQFELSYRAFIETEGPESLSELADEEYRGRVDASAGEGPRPEAEGPVAGMSGESHYWYRTSDTDGDSYELVRIVKSGVYEVRLTGPDESTSEPVAEQDFRRELLQATPFLDRAFERHIPDEVE
jgi:predicted  nucleic acid-binding Zn-ribbon protein